MLRRVLCLVFCCFVGGSALASAVTLTFDEIPSVPVDGLSFMGVTFDFKVGGVDSIDANYNSIGPGSITFVQDPSLEGDSFGVLTLDFTFPTPVLSFGIARSTFDLLSPGLSVELFDASFVSLGVFNTVTFPAVTFSESFFSFTGSPVRRAVLQFPSADTAPRFALDNLTFATPEPGSLLLLGMGLLAAGALARRNS